jgi:hypothetical protein
MNRGQQTMGDSQKSLTKWIFTGLRGVNLDTEDEMELGDGFFLFRPNDFLLSARWRYAMNEREYEEAAPSQPLSRIQAYFIDVSSGRTR